MTQPSRPSDLDLRDGPTRYVDRPANEGKHGDAAEEPNSGTPRSNEDPENSEHPSR